jgi:hypothetical protein
VSKAWLARTEDVAGGRLYRVSDGTSALSFRRLFERLASDVEFADGYTQTLAAFRAPAFYWEHPPLTAATLDDEAEFALLTAPALARLAPEPGPFASHFEDCPKTGVVSFPNLGGDAWLVVPCPITGDDAYPHIAAFLRKAPRDQVRALWRVTAATALERVSDTPLWLSTAGTGVAWLHVRFDDRPKYYRHAAYARRERDPEARACQVLRDPFRRFRTP